MTALETARANRIQRSEQEQIVNKANPMAGYTSVYKTVTESGELSDGAYRTYLTLLGYDYHNGRAIFPGLDKLAEQRHVTRRTIQAHITELRAAGLLIVHRRGLGLTNEYELPDASAWTDAQLAEWKKSSHQQRSGSILHIHGENICTSNVKQTSHKEETVPKKKQTKEEEGVCAGKPRRAPATGSERTVKDTDLERVSTDDDPDAPASRRLALDLARIMGWDTVGVDTLRRYECYYTARLAEPYDPERYDDAECRLMAFNGWLESNGYWDGNGWLFKDGKMAEEWNDWVGKREPRSKPQRRSGKQQSSIGRAYRDANGGA